MNQHTGRAVVAATILFASGVVAQISVEHDGGFVFALDGRRVAEQQHPLPYPEARLIPENGGLTVLDTERGMRAEIAFAADAAEFTWSYALPAPSTAEMTLRVPLPDPATVTVIHGSCDKAPTRTVVPPDTRTNDLAFGLPRFIVITLPDGSGLTIDPLPMGVWGLTGAAHDIQSRGMKLRFEQDAVILTFFIAPAYHAWRATLRGKLVLHSRPLEYDLLHPWQKANYRHGFEHAVRLAFSHAPPPKKAYQRHPVAADTYTPERAWGWLEGMDDVTIEPTGVDGAVYGSRAVGRAPAVFRIDIPAGHYYLTLNFGSADAATGPLTVEVNGEERMNGLHLESGRFQAVPLWVTSREDHIRIRLSGAATGAYWQLNALTVSAMGTLNEDYTLTRSWWRFEH